MLVSYNVLIHNTMFLHRILYFTDWHYHKLYKVTYRPTSFNGPAVVILAGDGHGQVGEWPAGLIVEGECTTMCCMYLYMYIKNRQTDLYMYIKNRQIDRSIYAYKE